MRRHVITENGSPTSEILVGRSMLDALVEAVALQADPHAASLPMLHQ